MPVKKPEEKIVPGMKIGKLTVLSPAESGKMVKPNWDVRCDCGREIITSENSLRVHNVRSCGMCIDDPRDEDFIGHKFGMLTVNARSVNDPYGKPMYECTCDCGNHTIFRREYLRKFKMPNCGCYSLELQREPNIKYSLDKNPIAAVWRGMKYRCENPKASNYDRYGGRGIKVCDRQHDLRNFVADMEPTYKPSLQLDRIDNNGDYEPKNCRWVIRKQNGRNKYDNHTITTAIGTQPMVEQSEVSGVSAEMIRERIDKGMLEELSIIPTKRERKLYTEELHQMFEGKEVIWLDEDTEKGIKEILETVEVQVEAIKSWGFGPREIIMKDN